MIETFATLHFVESFRPDVWIQLDSDDPKTRETVYPDDIMAFVDEATQEWFQQLVLIYNFRFTAKACPFKKFCMDLSTLRKNSKFMYSYPNNDAVSDLRPGNIFTYAINLSQDIDQKRAIRIYEQIYDLPAEEMDKLDFDKMVNRYTFRRMHILKVLDWMSTHSETFKPIEFELIGYRNVQSGPNYSAIDYNIYVRMNGETTNELIGFIKKYVFGSLNKTDIRQITPQGAGATKMDPCGTYEVWVQCPEEVITAEGSTRFNEDYPVVHGIFTPMLHIHIVDEQWRWFAGKNDRKAVVMDDRRLMQITERYRKDRLYL